MQEAVCKVEAHNLSRAEINVRTGMQISGFNLPSIWSVRPVVGPSVSVTVRGYYNNYI